jgi:hypothetical protein
MYQRTIQKEEATPKKTTTISAPGTLKIPPARQAIGYGSTNFIAPPPPPQSINNSYNQSLPPTPTTDTSYNNYNNPSSPSISNGCNNQNVPPSPSSGPYQPTSPIPQRYNNKPNQHPSSPQLQYSNKSFAPPPTSLGQQQRSYISRKPVVAPPLFEGQQISFSTDIKRAGTIPVTSTENSSKAQKAKALYAFTSQEPGDLSFGVGDVILVTEKTETQHEWWTGTLRGVTGSVSIVL